MHDVPLDHLEGWPDVEATASVVRCVKASYSIVKDPSLPAGNWNCVVHTLPILNDTTVEQPIENVNNNIYRNAPGTPPTVTVGSVNMFQNQSGTFNLASLIANPGLNQTLTCPEEYCQGLGRVCGMGIEVNNTTAEIYKQGTVTVYRMPQQHLKGVDYVDTRFDLAHLQIFEQPYTAASMSWCPGSLDEAMLIPGSRQWKAADGAYCVVPFVGIDNPILPPEQRAVLVRDAATLINCGLNRAPFLIQSLDPSTSAVNPLNTFYTLSPNKVLPMHSSGMIFTGLSEQTTLTLTVNTYIETFPTPSTPGILSLATPSAPYDIAALEMFQKMLSELPVGVEASQNAWGDWFAGAISTIAKAVAPTASVFHPGFGLLARGVGGIADSYLASPSSQPQSRLIVTQRNAKPNSRPPPVRKKKVVTPKKNTMTLAQKRKMVRAGY